ncbi:unnamed protein product [Cylicocyclus nassatus]|uniref:Uncharacterized protein n=1 Tax=Cylicocyclus nassatus TaxID=53992 RepID=A0AA36GKP9_CYLNA|nr:unnamed protein product [Cylicocyclus nassatus]
MRSELFFNGILRLIVDSGTWYISLEFFDYLSKDISSHSFTLIHSMLVMIEEVAHFYKDAKTPMRGRQIQRNNAQYPFVSLILLFLLGFAWMIQLLICIFCHNLVDKIVGALAALFWRSIIYHSLYPYLNI